MKFKYKITDGESPDYVYLEIIKQDKRIDDLVDANSRVIFTASNGWIIKKFMIFNINILNKCIYIHGAYIPENPVKQTIHKKYLPEVDQALFEFKKFLNPVLNIGIDPECFKL
ncbi:MAG: hypothetical protein ACOCP8_06580 [archaeon]